MHAQTPDQGSEQAAGRTPDPATCDHRIGEVGVAWTAKVVRRSEAAEAGDLTERYDFCPRCGTALSEVVR